MADEQDENTDIFELIEHVDGVKRYVPKARPLKKDSERQIIRYEIREVGEGDGQIANDVDQWLRGRQREG